MSKSTRGGRRPRPVSMLRLVAQFAAAGLVVLAALALLIAYLARQAGTEQAIQSAEDVSWLTAQGIVEPLLTPEVIAGDPTALAAFNTVMQEKVIRGPLIRVKLWAPDGRIIYSDESRLIGNVYPLGQDELDALLQGETDSAISDLDEPENQFEQSSEQLLEVYTGVESTTGEKLLFETYFQFDAVAEAGQAEWRKFAPAALGGLLVLELVQIPLAWSMARRVQRQQQDAERLLQHAVDASDAERRRIAGDLHDGIVQQLSGLTFALDAARLGKADPDNNARLIAETAAQLRRSTGELRSLLVDIYPPDLAQEGLPAALAELAGALERAGLEVVLDVDEARDLPLGPTSVLFRSAQEILRNVTNHSGSERVTIRVTQSAGTATLMVDDDGRGFEESRLQEQRQKGHVGLRALGDLISNAGGRLTVRSSPGHGTRVEVEVPSA